MSEICQNLEREKDINKIAFFGSLPYVKRKMCRVWYPDRFTNENKIKKLPAKQIRSKIASFITMLLT